MKVPLEIIPFLVYITIINERLPIEIHCLLQWTTSDRQSRNQFGVTSEGFFLGLPQQNFWIRSFANIFRYGVQ